MLLIDKDKPQPQRLRHLSPPPLNTAILLRHWPMAPSKTCFSIIESFYNLPTQKPTKTFPFSIGAKNIGGQLLITTATWPLRWAESFPLPVLSLFLVRQQRLAWFVAAAHACLYQTITFVLDFDILQIGLSWLNGYIHVQVSKARVLFWLTSTVPPHLGRCQLSRV